MDVQNIKVEDISYYQEIAIAYGLKFLGAIAIFFIGRIIVNFVVGLFKRAMNTAHIDDTLSTFICNIARIGLLVLVIIAALSQLGVETTSLAAIIAAAGLAVGLALQGSLSNFAAGVMIIMFRPFKLGDTISTSGVIGTVKEIGIFTTILHKADNVAIIIPNGKITSDIITNFSSQPQRRLDLTFNIALNNDIDTAKSLIEDVLSANDMIEKTPSPEILVGAITDTSLHIYARAFTKNENHGGLYFVIMEAVKKSFDKNGIAWPAPPVLPKV